MSKFDKFSEILSGFPRLHLTEGATPIQYLERLSRYFGGVNIYLKRDDVGGLGGGGNKLRKLEYLFGDGLRSSSDTVLTVGARQSNHARLTAATAAHCGIDCELFLSRKVQRFDENYISNGNILLNSIFGAKVHDLSEDSDSMACAESRAEELRQLGRRVFVIPMGGSNAIGSLGYVDCAFEIIKQAFAAQIDFDQIIVPNGSGGTHAGLAVGFAVGGVLPSKIKGIAVYDKCPNAHSETLNKANEVAKLIDPNLSIAPGDIVIDDGQLGNGYGIPTDEMRMAVRLLGAKEGLLLDPVYSGKAFGALIEGVDSGRYRRGDNVLFIMTGGLPGLFAYSNEF